MNKITYKNQPHQTIQIQAQLNFRQIAQGDYPYNDFNNQALRDHIDYKAQRAIEMIHELADFYKAQLQQV